MIKPIAFLKQKFFKTCPKTGRIRGIRNIYSNNKFLFPVFGILALVWFLIRVVPKPSRIAYPCQQAAAGIGLSFLVYVTAFVSSYPIFRLIYKYIHRNVAYLFILALVLGSVITINYAIEPDFSKVVSTFVPYEGPNSPIGVGKGLFSGRVVWVRDTASTNWDGKEKYWWDDEHTDQRVVSNMFSEMLRKYTETSDDKSSWNAIFRHFNKTHERGDILYKPGEKVVIKINCNHDKSFTWDNEVHPSPAAVYALVSQLIDVVGVSGNDITIFDGSRFIGNPVYNKIRSNPGAEYQKVWFASKLEYDAPQRFFPEPDTTSAIYFSIKDTETNSFSKKIKFFLPKCYSDAKYIINFSILRGHRVFGVTLSSKNHFGSVYNPLLNEFKPGKTGSLWQKRVPTDYMLHSFSLWDYPVSNKLGDPSFAPSMLGHKDLGGKELIYLIDGIFTSKGNETGMIKFSSIDNDWCSSLFISQDPVALESVGTEILTNEPNVTNGNPSFTPDLENFLRESALANHSPSGMKYDPENDGKYLSQSLGVHEHWNNSKDKKYSRNLGKKEGIELIMIENM